jgi:hypothetical protein
MSSISSEWILENDGSSQRSAFAFQAIEALGDRLAGLFLVLLNSWQLWPFFPAAQQH